MRVLCKIFGKISVWLVIWTKTGYSFILACVRSYLPCNMILGIADMNMRTLRRRPLRSGFTLIELLVVIAIVSMLLSIMMPGLKGAKEAGKQIACLSNIRQLTMGWTSYNADNEERLCAPHTRRSESIVSPNPVEDAKHRWVKEEFPFDVFDENKVVIRSGVLYSYVNDPGPYKCDADRFKRFRSYAMAHGMGAKVILDDLNPVTRFTKIKNTSSKIVFADAEAGIEQFQVSKSFCPVSFRDGWWQRLSYRCFISARHRKGSNFSFADGHVEDWKWKDRRTVDLALGIIEATEAPFISVNNEDLARMFKALRVD